MDKIRRFISKIPSLSYDNKYPQIISLVLCCLLSLFSVTEIFIGFKIGTTYFSFYRITALISLVFFILYNRQIFNRLHETGIKKMMILFAIWALISLIQIPFFKDFHTGFKSILVFFCSIFVYLFLYTFISNKKQVKLLLLSITIAIMVMMVFCLIEIFTGHYFESVRYGYTAKWESNIFNLYNPAIYANPNNTSFLMYISFVVLLLSFIVFNNKIIKISFVILMFVAAFIIVCTNSRAGLYTAVLFPCLTLLSLLPFKFYKVFRKYVFLPVVALAIIGIVLFLSLKDSSVVIEDQSRIDLYTNAFYTLFHNSYGFGVGLGQMHYYLGQFSNTGGLDIAHSFFVEILLCSGVIVFSIIAVCFVLLIDKYVLRFYKNGTIYSTSGLSALVMSTSMVCFVLMSFSPSSFFEYDWFWFVVALLAVFSDTYIFGKENDENVEQVVANNQ